MTRYNKVYLRATIISIGIILLNQLFIQYWLYQKKEDAKIINMGGRQRMFSQKLLGLAYDMYLTPSTTTKIKLNAIYDEWKYSHHWLLKKYESDSALESTKKNIHAQLMDLSPYIDNTAMYLEKSDRLSKDLLRQLSNNQNTFLKEMNNTVSNMEAYSSWKLTLVIIVEIIFAFMSLFIIYYEITYIFKRITNKIGNKNQALEASNQMLEQYAYLAAHDLRSPTQNIINFSNILNKKLGNKLDDTEKTYFKFILDSATRMQSTTNDLLMFSSINTEKLHIEDCQPTEILNDVFKDIAIKIREKQAQINVGKLPDTIKADKTLLHLVFQNLISNGIKFVSESVQPNVEIQYKSRAGHHVFTVSDNGIGIAEEDQVKIFKLFKRLHRREVYQGSGIGLSICKKVVERHHGTIHLESIPTKGSNFSFSIPKELEN